ncbi:MAG: hypothetical protein ACFE7R_11120 [Candidatus Hodarchaeota archaeon]
MELDRSRILLIIVASVPFAVGSVIGGVILDNPLFTEAILTSARSYSPAELLVQALISTGLGASIVLALFYFIQRRGSRSRRFLVAMVVSPILTVVFFVLGQALLLILFKGASNNVLPSIISFGSLAVFILSIVFIMMDAVPPLLKNGFVAFYGSIFGTFLGVSFVTSSMLVLMFSLIIEDYLLSRYSPAAEAARMVSQVGSDPFDYTRIQSQNIAVGAGDFVAFSLIAAHSLLYFPIYVWITSIALALLGIIINSTILLKEGELLPAIPLPTLLAMFPWFVHLIAYLPYLA